ncbi:MAG: MBL fold metallo-hydrolase [Deltaproteobacteria bacterium]|nr:MBL fold metallo-hydrolase [Deltaproteobacteria bacterium]
MIPENIEIIQSGEANGNQWIIRLPLPSGRVIFGLATENIYGGDWDLGPTWNYLIQGEEGLILIDTGRFGMGARLLEMLERAGLHGRDLTGITLTHGHEDHDGGLAELVRKTGAPVWVHPLYDRLRRSYAGQEPNIAKRDFSASCWHCFMPETFTQSQCRQYHRERDGLETNLLKGRIFPPDTEIQLHHLPGHCPDSLAFQIGSEALIIGDTLLPDITPHPSQEAFFTGVRDILPPADQRSPSVYGLRTYIRSLKKMQTLGRRFPRLTVLPAHRFYYNNRWGIIDAAQRSAEIIEHHRQRGLAIRTVLQPGPRTAEEIARELFAPQLLKGLGIRMAVNEVRSHLELLVHSGDVYWPTEDRAAATGETGFEDYIRRIEAD